MNPARPATLLHGIDRAAFAMAFAHHLRTRGVAVGLTAVGDFVRAIEQCAPTTRQRLYWTARVSVLRTQVDLPVFDAVFAAVFEDAVLEIDPHTRRTNLVGGGAEEAREDVAVPKGSADPDNGPGLPWATLPRVVGTAEERDEPAMGIPLRLPAELAGLPDVPFDRLDPQALRMLGRSLEDAVRAWPTRRTRRRTVSRGGGSRVALRATMAQSRRTGWEPVRLVRTRAVDKPRRIVMLCDVSESMRAQATAYLHLMRALAVHTDAEVFAFATSLTRLTGVLTHRSPEVAIEQASVKVADRFGGTRIATNVRALLGSFHADAVRGAVVLIGSDGWDSDPPEQLATAMARLRRRAHRVIWLNPRAAAPGFEPRVAALAAALPHCDELVPADDFASLTDVLVRLGPKSRPLSSRGSHGSRAGTGRR